MSSRAAARRRLLALALLAAAVVGAAFVALRGGDERLVPGGGDTSGEYDPLAYDSDLDEELARRARTGLADVVYEKSPGGVVASARRTARWRQLVERAAATTEMPPDLLEAIVFLESAGRPDAVAGDLEGAVGLTQILAGTAQDMLGMTVDLERSRELSARLETARADGDGMAALRLERARRRADERFDPRRALEGAARYFQIAREEFGRDDLAIASYHMGLGNLSRALDSYGEGDDVPYVRLFFDTAPLRKTPTYEFLSSLGDDSSTYLWKVLAAEQIMRLHRERPAELERLERLDEAGGPAARRLHPRGAPAGPAPQPPPAYLRRLGLRLTASARRAFAPRPETLATLVYIGAGTQAISGQGPLTVTSARGVRIQVDRTYASERHALAFEFMLDRLQAWNLLAWARGEERIEIIVGREAGELLPPAAELAEDALRE